MKTQNKRWTEVGEGAFFLSRLSSACQLEKERMVGMGWDGMQRNTIRASETRQVGDAK